LEDAVVITIRWPSRPDDQSAYANQSRPAGIPSGSRYRISLAAARHGELEQRRARRLQPDRPGGLLEEELEADGLEMTPCQSNFPQKLELTDVSYQYLDFSEGSESKQGSWAKESSVDGKGKIRYVAEPPAMGEVPELGPVDPRLQGTPKKPHKAAA